MAAMLGPVLAFALCVPMLVVNGQSWQSLGLTEPVTLISDPADTPWSDSTVEFHEGTNSLRTHDIFDSAGSGSRTKTSVGFTTTGPKTLKFWWTCDSESRYDNIKLYLCAADGTECISAGPTQSGEHTPWESVTQYLGAGPVRVKWEYSKDHSVYRGRDACWVDEVSFHTFDEALNNPGGSWSVDRMHWTELGCRFGAVHCARSLDTGLQGTVSASVTFEGPGSLSFWWRADTEATFDFFTLELVGPNGLVAELSLDGTEPWQSVSLTRLAAGSHTATWKYIKDPLENGGEDAGWLSDVIITQCGLPNCVLCDNEDCQDCLDGWSLSGGTCYQCSSTEYHVTTTSPCAACYPVTNCIGTTTCTTASDQSCDSCSSGSWRTSAGQCPTCPTIPNCINTTCPNGQSVCEQCASGWELGAQGTQCDDVNACANDPCDAVASCQDDPAPALTATCTCGPGYSGQGTPGTCSDNDACVGGPGSYCDVNADCTDLLPPSEDATCACQSGYHGTGEVGGCVAIEVVPNSLTGGQGVSVGSNTLLVDSTVGGQVINFQVQGTSASKTWSGEVVEIRFASYSDSQVSTKCIDSSCVGFDSANSPGLCSCIVPSGVGIDLSFMMTYKITLGSSESTGSASLLDLPLVRSVASVWAYPPPIITNSTLGFFNVPAEAVLSPSDRVAIASTQELLGFSGVNFVGDSRCKILLGGPASAGRPWDEYECHILPRYSSTTQLVCSTPVGADGTDKTLAVVCGEQRSNTNAFVLDFPTGIPIVNSVFGCQSDPLNPLATAGCPTVGGVTLHINGTGLLGSAYIILVGGRFCNSAVGSLTLVTCNLPGGAGLNQPLLLAVDGVLAPPQNLVSYQGPSISSLVTSGCVTSKTSTGSNASFTLTGCPRTGVSPILTIHGTNFGEALAEVVIGTSLCRNLEHRPADPHETLVCTLPDGNGLSVPLVMSVFQGGRATQLVTVSYTQCQPGTRQAGVDGLGCSQCPPGRFSADFGSLACLPCEAGKANPKYGQTNCTQCLQGESQPLPAKPFCDQCPSGRFSDSQGRVECKLCPAGRFGNGTSSRDCYVCPVGRYQNASAATRCEPCRPGTQSSVAGASYCSLCPRGTYSGDLASPCQQCEEGTAQALEGQTACIPCAPGKFTASTGRKDCQLCEAGRFLNHTGQLGCTKCSLGKYQSGNGALQCDLCKAGQYGESTGRVECRACPAGKYSRRQGLTVCDRCDAGRFQESESATACKTCLAGKFAGAGSLDCTLCVTGTFTAENQSEVCTLCPAGRFQRFQGSTHCEECEPGHESVPGLKACTACGAFQVAPLGTQGCSVCPPTTIALDGIQCACKPGSYGTIRRNSSGTDVTCTPCEFGSSCLRAGLLLSTLPVKTGWWRANNESASLYRCFYNSHCNGGAESECAPHRIGVLCAQCEAGYQVDGLGGLCVACGSTGENVVLSMVVLILVLLGLLVLYYLVIRAEKDAVEAAWRHLKGQTVNPDTMRQDGALARQPNTRSRSKQSIYDTAGAQLGTETAATDTPVSVLDFSSEHFLSVDKLIRRKPNFVYKMKIFVGFIQVAMKAVQQGAFSWPRYFTGFLNIFAVFNFDFIPWQSLECVASINYLDKALAVSLMPLAALLLIFLFYYIPALLCARADMADDDSVRHQALITRKKFIKLLLFTVFLVYPHVSALIVGVYDCITIEGVSYLARDTNILCNSDLWYSYAGPLVVALIVYPVGVPVFYLLKLRRRSRNNMQNPLMQLELGFLYMAYNQSCWYFEVVDMGFKLLMTSVLTFLPNYLELGGGLVAVGTYLIFLLLLDPYLRKGDFRLHLVAMVELLLLYMVGNVMQSLETDVLDELTDILISALLITLVLALIALFLLLSLRNGLKMWRGVRRRKLSKALSQRNSPVLDGSSQTGIGITPTQSQRGSVSTTPPPSAGNSAHSFGSEY